MIKRFGANLGRSISIAKATWPILRRNPELAVLPAVSAAALFGAVAGFIVAAGGFERAAKLVYGHLDHLHSKSIPVYVGLGVIGWVFGCVSLFFRAALVSCLLRGYAGEKPSIRAGLAVAYARSLQIIGWSFVVTVVGLLIGMLREWFGDKLGFLGNLVGDALEVGFGAVTFFCLPVLVEQGVGPIAAVKQSSAILRRTWGEALVASVGLNALSLLLSVPALVAVAAGVGLIFTTGGSVATSLIFSLVLIYFSLVTMVMGVLDTIFRTGLYVYAATGTALFDEALVSSAFQPKTAR